MRRLILVVVAVLFSGTAQAAQLTCTGEILGYNLVLRAKMAGARFTSKANVVISKDTEVLKKLNMRVTSSRFVAGESLYFTAQDSNGKIVLNTTYNGQYYAGTVDASGEQGSITVGTNCVVK